MADTRPICVICNVRCGCIKNGVANTYADGAGIQIGDMYQCPGCKATIVVEIAQDVIYEERAPDLVARLIKEAVSSC